MASAVAIKWIIVDHYVPHHFTIFDFPINFASQKPAVTVTNGDHVTVVNAYQLPNTSITNMWLWQQQEIVVDLNFEEWS